MVVLTEVAHVLLVGVAVTDVGECVMVGATVIGERVGLDPDGATVVGASVPAPKRSHRLNSAGAQITFPSASVQVPYVGLYKAGPGFPENVIAPRFELILSAKSVDSIATHHTLPP